MVRGQFVLDQRWYDQVQLNLLASYSTLSEQHTIFITERKLPPPVHVGVHGQTVWRGIDGGIRSCSSGDCGGR